MKVKFSKSVDYKPEWNKNHESSDPFTATIKPAEMGDLLDIVDAFSSVGMQKIDTETADPKAMRTIVEACASILPKYVELKNLTDLAGNALQIDALLKFLMFTPLAVELLGKLVEISTPSDDDEGN